MFAFLAFISNADSKQPSASFIRIGKSRVGVSSKAVRTNDVSTILARLNAARAARHLTLLALDPRLCSIATSHARDMAERGYFGHFSPEGASPFDRMTLAHYRFGYAGENLALDRSAEAATLALWNSSEHRSNMLQPHYARVGIAAVVAANGEIFVEDFSD